MDYYIERLNRELRNIITFWQKYAIKTHQIASEVYSNGNAAYDAPLGSIYISRLLYGTSATCLHLKDRSYQPMADLAYSFLRNQLTNPYGGYYWAVNRNGKVIHDTKSISMAQAFVMLGLSQYYALTHDEEVKREMFHHIDFIENKLKHIQDSSYVEGFEEDWSPALEQLKLMGTHLHLLEAYMKFTEVTGNNLYITCIEKLIRLFIARFVNTTCTDILHQFDLKWNPYPNETWLGHNLEAGWIVYNATLRIENKELQKTAGDLLLKLCDYALELGFDKQYGGMFNRFINGEPITTSKEWWVQAESVIAFFYAYQVSNDRRYLSYAIRIFEYIDNTFSDQENGEWFDSITREGRPINENPKLHFWKSMYHNVRYCIESAKQFEQLFIKA